ncbi:hypothetical protein E4U53_002341 [Claviceps sorghi]|nr:hypothetical protein E4U53_002341 [Claviceps sorghi]
MDSRLEPGYLAEIARRSLAVMDSMSPVFGSSPFIKAEPDTEDINMVGALYNRIIKTGLDTEDTTIKAEPDAQDSLSPMVDVSYNRIIKAEPDTEDTTIKAEPDAQDSLSPMVDVSYNRIIKAEPDTEDTTIKAEPDAQDSLSPMVDVSYNGIIKAEPDTEDTTMVGMSLNRIIKTESDTEDSFSPMVGVSYDRIIKTEPDTEDTTIKAEPDTEDSLSPMVDVLYNRITKTEPNSEDSFPHSMEGLSPVQDHDPIIKTEPEAEALALFPDFNHESAASLDNAREPRFWGKIRMKFRAPVRDNLAMAMQEVHSSQDYMVLWTGAASGKRPPRAGYSVASNFNRGGWGVKFGRDRVHHTMKYLNLKGIELALRQAAEDMQSTRHAAKTINLFNSDKTALQVIKELPRYSSRETFSEARRMLDVLESISVLSRRLTERGTMLWLYWLPQRRIRGSLLARSAALYAASRPNGLSGASWTFPRQAMVNHIFDKEKANPDMFDGTEDEISAEVKTEVKTEVQTEVKADVVMKDEDDDDKTNALVKAEADDYATMSTLIVKKEEQEEETERRREGRGGSSQMTAENSTTVSRSLSLFSYLGLGEHLGTRWMSN